MLYKIYFKNNAPLVYKYNKLYFSLFKVIPLFRSEKPDTLLSFFDIELP